MMSLLCRAKKVITVSGGLQKEAYFANVPALVMMPDTRQKNPILFAVYSQNGYTQSALDRLEEKGVFVLRSSH